MLQKLRLSSELENLLRTHSRSFYLTLSFLPRKTRCAISLAYLTARLADTIADSPILALGERRSSLEVMREFLEDGKRDVLEKTCRRLLARNLGPAEDRLIAAASKVASAHFDLSPEQQRRTRWVLLRVLEGLRMDLDIFGDSRPERPVALPDRDTLDKYCYCVAGSVGRFWTEMHIDRRDQEMIALGERFGKGLQLVNILRDLSADLQRGRCYLPLDQLERAGLEPHSLTSPESTARLRPIFDAWLGVARGHLQAAWRYLDLLPASPRLRACSSWPLLIGLRTLDRLAARPLFLSDGRPVKISRREVYSLLLTGAVFANLPLGLKLAQGYLGSSLPP